MLETRRVMGQILALYLSTTSVFLVIFFSIWYEKLYKEAVISQGIALRQTHRNIVVNIINSRFTPIEESAMNLALSTNLKFAVFDDENLFFSNVKINPFGIDLTDTIRGTLVIENQVFFIAALNSHDFFIRHKMQGEIERKKDIHEIQILVQGVDLNKEFMLMKAKVIGAGLGAFAFFVLLGLLIVKIAIRPLESKILTLNRFIKDSTHEINTPLSVILMSIEQLERQNIELGAKFARIKLATKTLSQIYSDLIFYNFPNTLNESKTKLNLSEIINERVDYFKLFFEQKKLELKLSLDENAKIFASKNQISKMLDNLISNAIKYNKKGGFIEINLKQNELEIKDNGCGIDEKNLSLIYDYYTRFNEDQGGFGIGLSLVKRIANDNNIKINCKSKLNEGTSFILTW